MECEVKWSEAEEAWDVPFRFGVDCCSFVDDVGGYENLLHNWSDVVPYAVVPSHFRDLLTAKCVLCKCIDYLATEIGRKCRVIEDFKMELELEFNHEDDIWRTMRFFASGHIYERIGSGRLEDFVEFFSEDWGD